MILAPVTSVAWLALTLPVYSVTGRSIVTIALMSTVWSECSYGTWLRTVRPCPPTRAPTLPSHRVTVTALAGTLAGTPHPIPALTAGLHAVETLQTGGTVALPGHRVTLVTGCVTSGADLYTVNTVMSC